MSNMTDLWLSGAIFSTPKYSKIRFRGAYDAPPDPLVGWGGEHPLPIPFPPRRLRRLDLGAFGASVVRRQTQIPGYAYMTVTSITLPRLPVHVSDNKC